MPLLRIRTRRALTAAIALTVLLVVSGTVLTRSNVIQLHTGLWSPAGNGLNLSSPRAGAAAVQLPDGRILITGGDDGSGAVATADIFDTNGNYSSAAPMNVARSQHTATLLADGTVLVAGGIGSDGKAANSAEIYTPSTNTWKPTGSLLTARSGQSATALPDGTVLMAGGDADGTPLGSLELYNPASKNFSAVSGELSSPRERHAAAALPNGDILIAGGWNGSAALATTDIYSYSSETVAAGAKMSTAREGLSATTQLDGNVLIAGGSDGSQDLASAEVYNAGSATFAATGSMATARQGQEAFLLPHSGAILIVGGTTNVGGTEIATASTEIYYPLASGTDANPSWNGTFSATQTMASPRVDATGSAMSDGTPTSVNDGVLYVAGGKDASGSTLSSGELYGFAWVKTDATDYAPGTTVNITGGGWQPGETVTLHLQESPYFDSHTDLTAVADSNGNISNSQFAPDSYDLDIRFYLTATGSSSGFLAQTTFTDSVQFTGLSVSAQTPNTVAPGSTAGYVVTAIFSGTKTTCNVTLSTITASGQTGLPAQATPSFAPATLSATSGGSQNSALSIETTGVAPGTYTFSVQGVPDSGCGGSRATATVGASLTVSGTAPQITSGSTTTFSAGSTGSFTVSTTGSPAPSLSENGALPSGVTFADNGNGTATLSGTPTKAGSYNFTITALNGISPNATQNFTLTVIAGQLASLTLNPATASITAGGSQPYTATGYDQYQNQIGDITGSTAFTVTNGSCTGSSCSSTVAGAQTVTGKDGGISGTAALTVAAGATTQLVLSPAAATITAGSSQAYTAQGLDIYGNPTGDLTAATTFTINGAGSCTAASCGSNVAGPYTVTGTYANGANGGAALTVNPGSVAQLQILLPGQTAAPGTASGYTGSPSVQYVNGAFNVTVNAVDQYFNLVNTVTDTVAISSKDAKAVLPSSAALVAGTGTFSVTPETVSYNPATTTFTTTDSTNISVNQGVSQPVEVIVAYTAAMTPAQEANAVATSYTLTISDAAAPNANTLESATIAIPANGGVPSNIAVAASNGSPVSWLADSNAPQGMIRVRACVNGDACYVPSSDNSVRPGGTITISFTTTANEQVSSTPVAEVWNTVAFAGAQWTNPLPLAPPEPTVGIGVGPSFTSAANTTFTYGAAGAFSVTTNGVPTNTLSESGTLPPGVTFTDNGNDTATIAGTPSKAGTYSFTLTAHNGYGSDATQGFTLTVNKADTTTAVVSSVNPSTFGQSLTFTASISVVAPGSGNPTGTVQFEDNGSAMGAAAALTAGSASVTTSALQAGPHNITALYSGDGNFNGSSNALSQTVNRATPVFSSLTSQTIAYGTKTITVSGKLAAPTAIPPDGENVTVSINGTSISQTVALSSGAFTATLNTSGISASATPYVITYSFAGDTNFNSASDASTSLTVNPAPTTTTVVSSLNPSTYGQAVTFTAFVTASSPAVPTGSVTFTIDGGAPAAGTLEVCPSALPTNRLCARITMSALTVGGSPHAISANYTNMDGNFVSGAGALAGGQSVSPAPLTITASSGVMIYGGTPFVVLPMYSGFVNSEGPGNLSAQPLCGPLFSAGTTAGPYASTCTGAADSNYIIGYVSGNVMVQQAASATVVTSSSTNNTSIYLQPVTFTAAVSPQFTGTPGGSVTFYDATSGATCAAPPANNTAPFGTPIAMVSGAASVTTSNLAGSAAPHTILACYSGDTNFVSSSGSVGQTVIPAPVIFVSPTLVNFTGQNVGTTSSPMSITLTNNGDADLAISSISIPASTDSSEFTIKSTTCGNTLGYPGEANNPPVSCTISVTFSPKDTGEAFATVQIIDNNDDVDGSEQDVTLTGGGLSTLTTSGSLFTNALFATSNACGSITLGGGAEIDSFNSTLGYAGSHQASGGNVGTNGNVTLNGNATINGAVAAVNSDTGSCKSSMTGLTTNGQSKVAGGLTTLSGTVNYPLPPAPNPAPPTTAQSISHSCPSGMAGCAASSNGVTLSPGTYGNVQVSSGTNVTLTTGTYNFNSLRLGGNSILTVGSGPVIVNIAGAGLTVSAPALDLTGGSIVNASGIPSNLEFFYAGSHAVNLTGGAQAYATMYAPAAPISMTGGSDFFGGIIGFTITNSGGTAIHYDQNLPNIEGGYLWLTAIIHNVTGLPKSGQVKLYLTNSTIQYTANGTNQTVQVPNAVVTLNSVSVTTPKTIYDLTNNRWVTSVPAADLTGNTFVTGVAIPVPNGGFPSGIQNLSWSAAYSTDAPNITFQWQWSAGVYSKLGSCYAYQSTNSAAPCYGTSSNGNALNVNPEDGAADLFGTDPAGTPENFKQDEVIGFFSAPAGVAAAAAEMSAAPSNYVFTTPQTMGTSSGISLVSVLTNNDGVAHAINSFSVLGTNGADFALQPGSNSCTSLTSLPAGASCNLYVIFTPASTGAESARIVVNDDANNTPQTVYLTGSGQ